MWAGDWLRRLLALRVTAVAAEVAARSVFELPATFGTLADEREVAVGCGGVGHGDADLRLRVGGCARRVGLILQAPDREHDALGDGLFGTGQQTLVEPDRVCARDLVETARHFFRLKAAAQHLRREQAHA